MEAVDRRRGITLRQGSLRYIVVHRLSLASFDEEANPDPIPDHLLTGAELVQRFRNRALGTGGATPYHALVCLDNGAHVEQLLRLSVRGAHAGDVRQGPEHVGYNWRSLAVAVVGNADERHITGSQYTSLVRVCSQWLPMRAGGLFVEGHTFLPGASKDPNKRCPGRFLDMDTVRRSVDSMMPAGWQIWNEDTGQSWTAQHGWEI